MTVRFSLKETTIKKIHSVFEKYPQVEQAILYGSRAKGNYRNGSDIDLTLVGGDELTMNVLYQIMDELDDLLLPYTFDISIYRDISDSDVRDHILRVGAVFYQRAAEPAHF
jgi:predicted nucleotidyltransferase